jgi:hypothetical protein
MAMLSRYVCPSTSLPGVTWHRSSHSTAANNCVETALLTSGSLAVRDSKDVAGPALLFAPRTWADFVRAVSDGGVGRA